LLGQDHSENAVLQNRLVNVDQHSDWKR